MPTTLYWLAADQNDNLGLFDLERWGTVPKEAAFLFEGGDAGRAIWRELHACWIAHVAPQLALVVHDVAAVPEAEGPHLVAFEERREDLPGARFVTENVARFERVGMELGERLAEDDQRSSMA